MKVSELMDRLKNVNPDAEVELVDVEFDSYSIDDTENFGDGDIVTIYIEQ